MSHCATQEEAQRCTSCGELCQLQWELHMEFGARGIGFAFQCGKKHKWAHCVPCKKCFGRKSTRHIHNHLKSKAHQERCTEMFTATEMSTAKAPPEARPPHMSQLSQPTEAQIPAQAPVQTPACETTQQAFSKQSSVHGSTSQPSEKKSEEALRIPQKPANQWLETVLKDTPLATMTQLDQCFASLPNCQSMHSCCITDLASHKGNQSCLWGLRHATKRAKCQKHGTQLLGLPTPSILESVHQMQCLIQNQSMTDKQNQRQCRIIQGLLSLLPNQHVSTFTPIPKQLGRCYGKTSHSMQSNLPCPKAEVIHGIAYVSPLALLAQMFGNGVPIDNIIISQEAVGETFHKCNKVQHISQCNKVESWRRQKEQEHYGLGSRKGPGTRSRKPPATKKSLFPVVVCLTISDWADSFGPSKVKCNRTTTDVKIITISPTKQEVNATNDTFACAVGIKGNHKGWEAVAQRVQADIILGTIPVLPW